jgi:phosphoglucomutase
MTRLGERPALAQLYAESFKDEAHLEAIVSEAQEMVNTALAE